MPCCDLQQKKAVMFRKIVKNPLEVDLKTFEAPAHFCNNCSILRLGFSSSSLALIVQFINQGLNY